MFLVQKVCLKPWISYYTSHDALLTRTESGKTLVYWILLEQVLINNTTIEVGFLVGYDYSRALAQPRIITGGDEEPYALKTDQGWSIVGSSPQVWRSTEVTGLCHLVSVKEFPWLTTSTVIRILETDLKDTNPGEKSISQDDIEFM